MDESRSKAVHNIRRTLGDDVLVLHGNDSVGINTERIVSKTLAGNHPHAVRSEPCVAGNDLEPMLDGLRHEHPVERISVVPRQACTGLGDAGGDRDLQEAGVHGGSEPPFWKREFAFRGFDFELPRGSCAEIHRMADIANRRSRARREPIGRVQRPEERMRVEQHVHRLRFGFGLATGRFRFGTAGSP